MNKQEAIKKLRYSKVKLVGVFVLAYALSSPTLKEEAISFPFTAPSAWALAISYNYLATQFHPTRAERKFIQVAKLP